MSRKNIKNRGLPGFCFSVVVLAVVVEVVPIVDAFAASAKVTAKVIMRQTFLYFMFNLFSIIC